MSKFCSNCAHFTNEFHKKDKRTEKVGICTNFTEVTFLTDTCKFHAPKIEIQKIEVIKPILVTPKQIEIIF